MVLVPCVYSPVPLLQENPLVRKGSSASTHLGKTRVDVPSEPDERIHSVQHAILGSGPLGDPKIPPFGRSIMLYVAHGTFFGACGAVLPSTRARARLPTCASTPNVAIPQHIGAPQDPKERSSPAKQGGGAPCKARPGGPCFARPPKGLRPSAEREKKGRTRSVYFACEASTCLRSKYLACGAGTCMQCCMSLF